MGTTVGNNGVVEVDGAAVAELRSWSFDESLEQIEDTAQGDTTKTFKPGAKTVSGTIECHWDDTDATGQGVLVSGAAVVLTLYPNGTDTGKPVITLNATIVGRTMNVARDSIIPRTFNYSAQGEPTEGVVA